jgi:SAM-dependent methyltransferase
MEESPFGADAVARQYDRWVYPRPLADLAESVGSGEYWDLFDPSRFRRKLWPRNIEPRALSILIAGCGANQAAYFAFTNRASHVLGIDISETALDCEARLKQKHGLDNLELLHMRLDGLATLGRSFDLIISTGVLHHLPDPDAGLRSLRDVLRPHGVIGVMVYGYYPRLGVYMMQELFRLFRLQQDPAGVQMVKHAIASLPAWHHLHRYLSRAPDLDYDGGIVDTFLHRQDRAFTVRDVLRFARDNGLKLQSWLDNLDYSVSASLADAAHPVRRVIEARPLEEQWQCMELFAQSLARQCFLLCHPDKDPATYTVDFTGERWCDYIPSVRFPLEICCDPAAPGAALGRTEWSRSLLPARWKNPRRSTRGPRVGMEGPRVRRSWHRVALTDFEAKLMQQVNGARRVREIVQACASDHEAPPTLAARDFFRRMAEWDHLLFEIP